MSLLSLAIETSGRNHAVALSADGKIVETTDAKSFLTSYPQETGTQGPGSSSVLLPMIRSVINAADVKPSQIGLISVTNGPGMFTGLRVGVVTAKTLAYALDAPLVAVDTLQACAVASILRHRLDSGRIVKTIINAQRGQLFAASFRVVTAEPGGTNCVPVTEAHIVDPAQWVSDLEPQDFLTGPGLKMTAELLNVALEQLRSVEVEEEDFRGCNVATVAAIGERKFHAGELASAWELKPIYFRPSAAEEVRSGK